MRDQAGPPDGHTNADAPTRAGGSANADIPARADGPGGQLGEGRADQARVPG